MTDTERDQAAYVPSPEVVALTERLVERMRELSPDQQLIFVRLLEAYIAVANEQRGQPSPPAA